MKYKFTHTAIQVGSDARTSRNYRRRVYLRRTKLYFVDKDMIKYYAKDHFRGLSPGLWSRYRIINIERKRLWHTLRYLWE